MLYREDSHNKQRCAFKLVLGILLLIFPLVSQSNEVVVKGPVNIGDTISQLDVGGRLEYLIEDPHTEYPDAIVVTSDFNAQFRKLDKKEANFGYVRDVYWFRLKLRNTQSLTDYHRDWLLELDYPFLDKVTAYLPNQEGTHSKMVVGDRFPFEQRWADVHSFLFPLILYPNQDTTVYFRIETSTSLQVPLVLWSEKGFIEKNAKKNYWYGVYYGVMLVMLVYNLFLYLSVRDKAYILYILYITTVMLTNMVVTGVAFQQLWPNSPWLANYSFPVVSALTSLFAMLFTRSFLQTQNYSESIDRVLVFGAVFSFVMIFFPLLFGQYIATVLAVFTPIPVGLIIIGVGLYGLKIKHRRAVYFVSAWGCLVVGVIARALLQFDLVPHMFITEYGAQLGSLAEVVLLSFALADRINTEKAEKLDAIKASLSVLKDKRLVEDELSYKSSHDQLTGAPNRSLFVQKLSSLIASGDAEHSKLLVCTTHLENFHEINFTLGHHVADRVLLEAVERLNKELGKEQAACLLSSVSNEKKYVGMLEGVYISFILKVQPEVPEHEAVERVVRMFATSFQFENMGLDLGGRIGIAVWPDDEVEALSLSRKSMIAVRSAKWSKLPVVCYDTNLDNYSEARLSLMGDLMKAIESDQLVLFYQPKIDFASGQVTGMEALVRWQHPTLGLLGPNHFIDLAESTGMIRAMTVWVLNAALSFVSDLRSKGYDLSIAINLSVRNLLDAELADKVTEMSDQFTLPRNKLTLEVVESAVIEDMDQAIKTLKQLSDNGFSVSLDDFGTGYSSLSYLKKLPIDELKIDRSFVMSLKDSKDDQVIVEMILAIAKQLQLSVVAEGIEDEGTMNKLLELGCDVGQGFYIQRPIAGEEMIAWLDKQVVAKSSPKS